MEITKALFFFASFLLDSIPVASKVVAIIHYSEDVKLFGRTESYIDLLSVCISILSLLHTVVF